MEQTKKRNYDRYTLAFKLQAVKLANHPNVTAKDIAEGLGIHVVMLYRWRMEYKNCELRDNRRMKPAKPSPKRRKARTDPAKAKDDELIRVNKRIRELEKTLELRTEELDLLKKSAAVLRESKAVKFAFIEKNRDQYKVTRLCDLLGVSTSGFYTWYSRPESQDRQYEKKLMVLIKEFHQGFRRSYGAARLHRELINKGYSCSRRRINRLMRELGIKASTTGLYAWRPGQHDFYSCTGNQLKHAPKQERSGVQWVGDFTYIKTRTGWLYHAVVLDLFSRKVVGWSFSRKRNAELTKSALRMAISRSAPQAGCIFHSDQGIEYAANEYRVLVESAGMTQHMSRKGNPLDNATAESFFHTLKAELVHHRVFDNDIDGVAHIVEYIEFYNRECLHSGIGYQSPEKYEKLCA